MLLKVGIIASAVQPAGGFDTDAQAYFTATGIVDPTVQNAINQLVLDLKSNSLWTKMAHIYPFPDDSSTHCAYNLKNATSELTYTGTPTFASTGFTADSTPSYADTNVNDNTMTFNDMHISFYSRVDTTGVPTDQWIAGVNDSSGGTGCIQEMTITNGASRQFFASIFIGTAQINSGTYANTRGLYTATNNSTSLLYRNATDITTAPGTPVNASRGQTWLIGNVRGVTPPTTVVECAWFSLGLGLSGTDVSNLYTVVQAFQTALSRQVT